MRIIKTKLGIDSEGKAVLIHECEAGVFENHLKFKVGFALADDKKGGYIFFAFKGSTDNPLAVITDKEKAVDFIRALLNGGGYKWIIQYKSEVEQVDGMYAFFVPFKSEGWNEVDEKTKVQLEQMLKILRGNKIESV